MQGRVPFEIVLFMLRQYDTDGHFMRFSNVVLTSTASTISQVLCASSEFIYVLSCSNQLANHQDSMHMCSRKIFQQVSACPINICSQSKTTMTTNI